ncbi:outer membrane protein assembly factor BamB family protein [Natrinema salifodinae]|uniref:Outer membrane protein assembly factor BamB, contains PQQ-like beta-propeller repeat n=1 Tax=Natrinema salifodinae TaxID=1202768 RepID=A0A1I0MI72_9EURY|nr:PQQ-binding-like beta-propeller repeat protein [Natrinema salifodinae]SEV87972.1 Outer membrane protein assembly factor BamB, contains PQQ-like beta-propeller repeat [Natrinema salifodinae]
MTNDPHPVGGAAERPRSRRGVLRTIGTAAGASASLAGCLGQGWSGDEEIPLAETGREQTVPDGVAQFRHSLERWGYYPDVSVPDDVDQAWRLDRLNTGSHSAAKASAVPLPDGGVVFPGDTGYLIALDADGEERWRAGTDTDGRGIHGTPAVADGRAYIGAYDGALYAVDLETGDVVWRRDLGGAIGSSPLYHDGKIVMAVEYPDPDGSIFVLDADGGEVLWEDPERRPTDHPHSTPAIDSAAGRLVCGSNDGLLYGWSYPDLEFAWSFETESPGNAGEIKGPIATYDGGAYFGSWDHHVYRVDLEDGTEDWSFETGDLVMSGPAIDPDLNAVFVGSHDGNLYALDAGSGERYWSFETDRPITGCPTVCGDRVLVGSKDSGLYELEKRTGELVWERDHDGVVTSTPRVIDGAIYYAERAPNPPADAGSADAVDDDGGGYKLVAAE